MQNSCSNYLKPHLDVCLLYFIVNISESAAEGEILEIDLNDTSGSPPLKNMFVSPTHTTIPCQQIDGEIRIGAESVKAVQDLRISPNDAKGRSVTLSWKNGQEYDAVIIERNGEVISTVSGDAEQYSDSVLDTGSIYWYKIRGQRNGAVSGAALVPFTNLREVNVFRRGDANADGRIDIADGVFVLSYLFNNRTAGCLDAADINDDGAINIADPVFLLTYIFSEGAAIPAPGGRVSWVDPTPDALDCEIPMY